MEIQKVNSMSFRALMIESGSNTPLAQKELMKKVIMNPEFDGRVINNLENISADVYVCANADEKSVDVKLRKSAGVIYSYVPNDDNGSIKSRFNLSDTQDEISRKMQSFVARAKGMACYDTKNKPINLAMEDWLNKIYCAGKAEVLKPEIIPDAMCYFGSPKVMTKYLLQKIKE